MNASEDVRELGADRRRRSESQEPFPFWLAAVAVSCGYYLGARFGFALTLGANPISVLWPPNSLLMAALLVRPSREWPWLIAAALPAHLLAEHQSGVPTVMILCWFLSNVTEALIGAYLVRRSLREVPSLTRVRSVTVFILGAALAAPFFSSFLDAAFVRLVGWGESSYWELWSHRVNSNVLAALTIVPLVLAWTSLGDRDGVLQSRRWEGAMLFVGLVLVCGLVFTGLTDRPRIEALYFPLPFLLWAAFRFGTVGSCTAFAVVVLVTILGAISGQGPFAPDTPVHGALVVQTFLVSVGAPLLFLTAVITERAQAVERSTESEQRFTSMLSASPDAVLVFRSADGAVLDANRRWEELFGPPRAGALASTLAELRLLSPRAGDSAGGTGRDQSQIVEMRTVDGEQLQTVWSTSSLRIAGDECIVAIVHDATKERRTEAELREQRNELMHVTRLSNLSTLAASLAHELMQPLTAILSNTQAARRLMSRTPVDYPEISEILDDIVQDDKRASEVIERLRLLMKKSVPAFDLLSLNELVRDTLVLTNGEFQVQGIDVSCQLGERLPAISGDRIQLQQVILNLFSNACDAMREVPRWRRALSVSTAADARFVRLSVKDAGPGLSVGDQQRIFEPFFTTKEDGMGMGLSICRSILAAHGGSIHATQNSPRGVTFHVVLPAAAASESAPRSSSPSRTAAVP